MADDDDTPFPVPDWPSINDSPPTEEGGPIARTGFTYQDEVAVSFLIEMLENASLVRVHCETHDDAVLIWRPPTVAEDSAEYVQVKAGEPDKLWSVADLCSKPTKTTLSIYEASLGRDRHREIASFRIVTLRPIVEALQPLTYPCGSEARELVSAEIETLRSELEERFPDYQSAKGTGSQYWLENCQWDVRYDLNTLKSNNIRRVLQLSNAANVTLLIDQIDQILDELRLWVKAAGEAKWVPDKAKKIIPRQEVLAWWQAKLDEIVSGKAVASGGKLSGKMADARLPDELINLALEMRRDYAAEVRTPRYMEGDRIADLQARVKSEALSLRASLVAGELDLSGAEFHSLCLARMSEIGTSTEEQVDVSGFVKGCLYDIADRCLMRFAPPTPR